MNARAHLQHNLGDGGKAKHGSGVSHPDHCLAGPPKHSLAGFSYSDFRAEGSVGHGLGDLVCFLLDYQDSLTHS